MSRAGLIMSLKTMKSRRDTAVQGTNDSSIVSKWSMSHLGYFTEEYLQYFVAKKCRRSPLINRGYYIRTKAVDYAFQKFIKYFAGSSKQVVSLGAGFDSTYFRLKKEGLLENTVYIEIDFPDVVKRKVSLIKQSDVLSSMLTEVSCESNPNLREYIALRCEDYIVLGIDLTQVDLLSACMKQLSVKSDDPTLLLSEVVITYMTPRNSNKVISWASEYFEKAMFVSYEQVYPHDGFGKVMMAHFKKLGSPLRSIETYPTTSEQVLRYRKLGWDSSLAVDMNCFFNNFVNKAEKDKIQSLEPFDEYEEWHLKCMHYVIVSAFKSDCCALKDAMWSEVLIHDNSQNYMTEKYLQNTKDFVYVDNLCGSFCFSVESRDNPDNSMEVDKFSTSVQYNYKCLELSKSSTSELLLTRGLQRFGHRLSYLSNSDLLFTGGFGQMGKQHTRFKNIIVVPENLNDVSQLDVSHRNNVPPAVDLSSDKSSSNTPNVQADRRENVGQEISSCPVERLFHSTLTLSDGRVLIYGGRTSPVKPCEDICCIEIEKTNRMGESQVACMDGSKVLESTHHVYDADCEAEDNYEDSTHNDDKCTSYGGADNSKTGIDDKQKWKCKWWQVKTSGRIPCLRWRHAACKIQLEDREFMLIHGGLTCDHTTLSDCYVLDIKTWSWHQVKLVGDDIGPLHSHSIAVNNNQIYISGGLNVEELPRNTIYVVQVKKHREDFEGHVEKIALKCDIQARYSHTSVVSRNHLILVGGVSLQYPTPHVTLIHVDSGETKNFQFQEENPEETVMLHNHQMAQKSDKELLIFGGGGNCFSFGTHLNSPVFILTFRPQDFE